MSGAASRSGPPRLAKQIAALAIAAVIAFLAFEAVSRIARDLSPAELRRALAAIEPWRIGAAVLLTLGSYTALSFYDGFALRLIGRQLTWRQTGQVAFSSYAISNNLGLALITGGSTRYAHYSRFGLSPGEVARVVLLCSGAFWTALLLLCGLVLTIGSRGQSMPLPPPFDINLGTIGAALVLVVITGWALVFGIRQIRSRLIGDRSTDVRALIGLEVAALIDVLFAASALFVLVGREIRELGQLAMAYAFAIVAGVASHVPGGLGVFEAIFLALAPVNTGTGLAALLLYRLIYYVLPLGTALALQLGHWAPRMLPASPAASAVARVGKATTPATAAILATLAGTVLLLSATTPALPERLQFIADLVPVAIVETSHLLASLAGTVLLLLGPALLARLRSAQLLATGLLVAGAVLCLVKGIDYEEGILLLIVAAFLQANSGSFYRGAGIGSVPIGALWWALVLSVLAAASVALLVTHYEFIAGESWLSVEFGHEASRSARAFLAAALLLGLVGFRQLIAVHRPSAADPVPPHQVLERAFSAARRTDAFLAFTGDKQFLVADEGDAFLMYRVHRRTWVVMGDPVGPQDRWPALAWRLREAADREAGLVCFYEVSDRMLPVLVDLGLATMKYGEEALIDTRQAPEFPKAVRAAMRRAEREGLEFSVIPAAEIRSCIPALKEVSDDWLRDKPGEEKCFSLGRFDPDYLARFDCAVVRRGEQILAFANLWNLPNRREASIDLMRRRHDSPNGTMEFLIGNCIALAAAQGYERFSLGIAPLSGLVARPLAPAWARLGATVFQHGNRLYGFKGLREFKQKFHPRWESRYIGTFHGWRGWLSLLDTARLIGE